MNEYISHYPSAEAGTGNRNNFDLCTVRNISKQRFYTRFCTTQQHTTTAPHLART